MFTMPFIIMMNFVAIPQQIYHTIAIPVVPVVSVVSVNKTVQAKESTKSIIPKIKTYKSVNGAKPITIVSLNCPTELVGISTPSSKIFHQLIDSGMSCINVTSLLPVELQQACS